MPFCVNCGSAVQGRFCEKCGTPTDGSPRPTPTGAQAAAPAPSPAPLATAPPPKKTSPVVYILITVAVLVVLAVGAVVAGGFFLVHKARQAGLDPALWERNPSVAAAKFLAATNPDAEVVSVDESSGTVVIRNRRDGKTVRFSVNDLKQGRFSWEEGGQKVTMTADSNGVDIRSADSTTNIVAGAALKLPAWLPAYAGAKDSGGLLNNGPRGETGLYGFKTSDAPSTVLEFYESALKKGGFTVENKVELGEVTTMSADNGKTSVQIAASAETGHTAVNITFGPKE